MTTRHKLEGTMTAKSARIKAMGVARFLAVIAIVVGVTTASSPQPASAVGQALVIDESVEEGGPRCGAAGDRECQSTSACIDLWSVFAICVKGYTYFPEKDDKKK